jgi:regulator of nucleoside diphosphate kinase
MEARPVSNRIVTIKDLIRLKDAIEHHRRSIAEYGTCLDAFRDELDRMEIVAPHDIPPDVVTLESRVRVRRVGNATGQVWTLTLPERSSLSAGRMSVLSPVGQSLVGARVGDLRGVAVVNETWVLAIEEMLFQPEGVGVLRAERRIGSSGA